ncbi:MAG: beta-ketoacyl-[acyl-carrier-protein] synthase family protein, partial [Proteobacteria bacterium]
MKRRVVITGLGVVAPNARNREDFHSALLEGRSGIRFIPELAELGFGCHVAAVPEALGAALEKIPHSLRLSTNESMTYAAISAMEAFEDAGLKPAEEEPYDDIGA